VKRGLNLPSFSSALTEVKAAAPAVVIYAPSPPRDPVGAIPSQAKATKGKAGTAGAPGTVRRSTAGTGLRVGESGAVLTATSEFMDATAGETAPNSTSFSCVNSFSGIGSARDASAMLHPGVVDGPTTLALQAGTVVTAGETATNSACWPPSLGGSAAGRGVCPVQEKAPTISDPTITSSRASGLSGDVSASSPFSSEFDPAGEFLVGERERRLSERLPAASAGSATAGRIIPFKAIPSRINSCAVDVELDAAISALEADWLARGLSLCSLANQKNVSTLRTDATSDASSADSCPA
jgi:hypothetical protein